MTPSYKSGATTATSSVYSFLDEIEQLLTELRATLADADDAAAIVPEATLVFGSRCKKCSRPILWAPTNSGRMVALEQRPGPYVLTEDGTAVWQDAGGLGYHYDGTPAGCPKQQVSTEATNQDDSPRRPEWQDIYDK